MNITFTPIVINDDEEVFVGGYIMEADAARDVDELFEYAEENDIPSQKQYQEDFIMTMRNKQELIQQVIALLNAMIEAEQERQPIAVSPPDAPIEMLTIKECAQQISGLSEHTIRQLVLQNKIPHIRTGQGKCGKILVPKSVLLDYLKSAA